MKTMERKIAKVLLGLLLTIISVSVSAGTTDSTATKGEFSVGTDLTSSYVWRGVKYGGVSFQPDVSFSYGGFSIGAWGSAGFDGSMEMDLYTAVEVGGLSIGLTDYYYPGTMFFDYENSHWIEANLGYGIKDLSFSANYMLLTSSDPADMYFELGYDFGKFGLAVGGGNGWHTTDGEFQVCNIALSAEKEIKVSDSFSIPVGGSIILNPNTEQFYIVVTASF